MSCAQALPLAIASVRDAAGRSFPEAAEALLEHLDHADNSGNPYSDDNALAALLEALGHLHLPSPEVSHAATYPPCICDSASEWQMLPPPAALMLCTCGSV